MKVTLFNTGKAVHNGKRTKELGTLVFEIMAESETERTILNAWQDQESRLRISVSPEGYILSVYRLDREKIGT